MNKHYTASGIIVNDQNQVLLVKHKKLGKWIYPGGHLEPNETPDECVIREIFEETKIKAEIMDTRNHDLADEVVSVLHNPHAVLLERIEKGEKEIHFHIDLVYICKILGRNQFILNENEADDIGFFTLPEMENLEMFRNCKELIRAYL